MQVNDTIELTIVSQGMNGEGVARHEGVVVFLPYTLVGERVLAKILSVKKKFASARAVKILQPSEMRSVPICPVYFKCGGCDFLHIDKSFHRPLKEVELINNFKKIAGLDVAVDEWVDSDQDAGYRNKVQLPFGVVDGRAALGYYAEGTHDFIPHDKCHLQGEWADKLSKIVLNHVKTLQISVYNEKTGVGLMRHLVMRKIGNKVAIVLVMNGDSMPHVEQLIGSLKASKIDFNLHYNINTRATNVIMSDQLVTVHGEGYIKAEIMGAKVIVSPLSFMQVNDYIRDAIYGNVIKQLQGVSVLFDLYSGVGITSNVLAKACDKIYSIEITESAVADAMEIVRLNGNGNIVSPICGDVVTELPRLIARLTEDGTLMPRGQDLPTADAIVVTDGCDKAVVDGAEMPKKKKATTKKVVAKEDTSTAKKFAVLLDPPRKGCDRAVLDKIVGTMPDKIVYVSCNHSTLARDIKAILDASNNAYAITNLTAYDMFPGTHHLESLVCLTRK